MKNVRIDVRQKLFQKLMDKRCAQYKLGCTTTCKYLKLETPRATHSITVCDSKVIYKTIGYNGQCYITIDEVEEVLK